MAADNDPIVLFVWDHLADRIAAVRSTGVALLNDDGTPTAGVVWPMAWRASLGVPGIVMKGYGHVPPLKAPAVYVLPPRVVERDGLSMGSLLVEATFPVIGFVDGVYQQADGVLAAGSGGASEGRIREAYRCMHDIKVSLEISRTTGPAFGGLPIFDFTMRNMDADDASLIGAGGFGTFYFEAVCTYEVPLTQKGL